MSADDRHHDGSVTRDGATGRDQSVTGTHLATQEGDNPSAGHEDRTRTHYTPSKTEYPTPSLVGVADVAIPGYEVLGQLGEGGMGVVYLARDTRLNRFVALKRLRGRSGKVDIIRFRAEAEAMASVQHPNVVQVYETGEHDGQPHLAMEFLAGGTLSQRLAEGRYQPNEFVEVVRRVASGVAAAHAAGIVHRDLKPANVLFDERGEPKVSDFGLAKRSFGSDLTETGAVMGTPAYMAPEQADGQTKFLGPTADVWALGVMLYEGLTGQRPFQSDSAGATLVASLTRDPVLPRRINPRIPRDLELICLKCLAKKPHERYPSAKELVDDLTRFQRGLPISVRPLGSLERTWRWCRRYPAAAGLLLSLLLGTLTALGLTVWAIGERDRANESMREARELARQAEEATRNEIRQRERAEGELARSLVAGVRELRVSKPLGWSWTGLEKLDTAYRLRPAALDPIEMRSLTAYCLVSPDVRPSGAIGEGIDTVAIACSPDSKRLAVAQRRSAAVCTTKVYDPTERKKLAEYTFVTAGSSVVNLLSGKTRTYHDGVSSLAFSPDGRWLVAGTRNGKLVRWDTTLSNPAPVVWRGHPDGETVKRVAFSADGAYLVSCSPSGTKRWVTSDAADWPGQLLGGPARDLAFSPDGRFLASASDPIRLYTSDRHPPEELGQGWGCASVAFSPDGRTLAALSPSALHFVDVADRRVRLKIDIPGPNRFTDFLTVRYSPDGMLVCTVWGPNRVQLWDAVSGQPVAELFIPDREMLPVPAFTSDGRFLAVASHYQTQLFEVRPQRVRTAIAHHPGPIRGLEFTANGELVCHADTVYDGQTTDSRVTVWDPATGRQLGIKSVQNVLGSERGFKPGTTGRGNLALSADGTRVATVSSLSGPSLWALREPGPFPPLYHAHEIARAIGVRPDELRLPPQGAELRDDPRSPTGRAVRLTPTGSGDGVRYRLPEPCLKSEAKIWGVVAAVRVEQKTPTGAAVRFGVHVDPNSSAYRTQTSAALPDADYQLYLFEANNATEFSKNYTWMDLSIGVPDPPGDVEAVWVGGLFLYPLEGDPWPNGLKPHRGDYSLLRFSPTGDRIWGISDGVDVVAWDTKRHNLVSRWHDAFGQKLFGIRRIQALAVDRDRVLVGDEAGVVQVLSAATTTSEYRWPTVGSGIRALALHPSAPLAVLGTQRGLLRLARVPTGEAVFDFPPHTGSLESLAFGAGGELLATGSLDGTVRVWRSEGDGYRLVVALPVAHGELAEVRLSPDGRWLAVLAQGERAVQLWDLHALQARFEALGLRW